ncbi:hypothetical protein HK102_001592 [Quaeritorhiza haematococci]|nr:hypothetical protein HK102_001592 [Quaeritorhiza haematococci]
MLEGSEDANCSLLHRPTTDLVRQRYTIKKPTSNAAQPDPRSDASFTLDLLTTHKNDSIPSKVWEAAFTVAELFVSGQYKQWREPNDSNKQSRKSRRHGHGLKGRWRGGNVRVLELGAGTGLVGLFIAKYCAEALGMDELVLTDLQTALPLLRKNAELNGFHVCDWKETTGASGGECLGHGENEGTSRLSNDTSSTAGNVDVFVEPLEWGNQNHAQRLQPPFDLVIGSDLVYFPHLFPPLIETLRDICDEETEVIIGYRVRQLCKEEGFFYEFGKYFEMTVAERIVEDDKEIYVFSCRKREVPLEAGDDTFWTMRLLQIDL